MPELQFTECELVRLMPKQGEVFVVTIDRMLDVRQVEAIQGYWRRAFVAVPFEVPLLVLCGGLTLGVCEARAAQTSPNPADASLLTIAPIPGTGPTPVAAADALHDWSTLKAQP